jgi:hypothetical protein
MIAAARFALPARRELLRVTAWRISNSDPAQSPQIKIARAEPGCRCGKATAGDGAFVVHLELLGFNHGPGSAGAIAVSMPIWVCIRG